jgi:hypothetical protein
MGGAFDSRLHMKLIDLSSTVSESGNGRLDLARVFFRLLTGAQTEASMESKVEGKARPAPGLAVCVLFERREPLVRALSFSSLLSRFSIPIFQVRPTSSVLSRAGCRVKWGRQTPSLVCYSPRCPCRERGRPWLAA